MYRRLLCRAIGGTAVLILLELVAYGQTPTTTDNPFPSRGFLPGTLAVESDAGDVSINSGNLNYRVPLFRFPGGPGSVAFDVGLVYNSFIYDADGLPTDSRTGGGWHYSFAYSLIQDEINDVCSGPDGSLSNGVRTSIVFPDGSRHLLQFNGPANYNVGFDGTVHCPANTSPLTGPLTFYTTDGTYVRVEVTAGMRPEPYKIFLSDGTRVEGDDVGFSISPYPTRIVDRNGNFLTIVASAYRQTPAGGFIFQPTFSITDQLGRKIDLSYALDDNYVPTDTLSFTAPGLGQPLSWIVVWRWYAASNPLFATSPLCSPPGTTCQTYPRALSVKEIQLPSVNGEQLKYAFRYYIQENSDPDSLPGWGELRSVTAPYGAVATYEYAQPTDLSRNFESGLGDENVRIAKKTISWTDPLGVLRSQQWTFTTVGNPAYPDSLNVTGPDGGLTNYLFCGQQGTYGNALRGKICVVTKPNQDLVRTKWKFNCTMPGFYDPNPQNNMFVATEFTTINGSQGTKTSVRSFDYDRNGNLLQLGEWDWQPGTISSSPSGPASRITNHAYWLRTPSLVRDPELSETCAGAPNDSNAYWNSSGSVMTARYSTEIADATQIYSRNEFFYDDPFTSANVIREQRWRSRDDNGNSQFYSAPLTSANSITITRQYDYGGALAQSIDANGIATTFNLNRCPYTGDDQMTHYSLPGEITRATNTPLVRSTFQFWGCAMALLTDSTDSNGANNHTVYDGIGRVIQRVEAGTRAVTINYNESISPVTMTTARTINTTGDNFQIRRLDRRGQIYQTQANDVYVDFLPKLAVPADGKSYEAVSNPRQAALNTTDGWTRTTFDQLNRPIQIDHFDGSALPYPWGNAESPTSTSAMNYDGAVTTFIDEAAQVRRETADGLGRLTQVQEDPYGLNYWTSYQYDPLDNLTTVIKSEQQDRIFTYDSLSRLYSATNPESGTITYRYDPNGNLIGKTDARNITTTIEVDELNRIKRKFYSDSTPAVTYCYDGATAENCAFAPTGSNLVDRLTMVSSTASVSRYLTYSPFGEVLTSQQITDGQSYPFSYAYNNLGQLSSIAYPSQRLVTTGYDAAGKATSVISPEKRYASSINYAANDALSILTFGNGTVEQRCYNSRLQTTAVRAGSEITDAYCSGTAGDFLRLAYTFNTAQNNGNIAGQIVTRGGNIWTQSYTYDGVNRLSSARETGAGNWAESYGYDSAGNRWVSAHTGTGMYALTLETGIAATWYSSQGNNRVATWSYDNAGNILHIGSMSRDFTYDAANRMTTATINGQTSTYVYDGEGRRVKAVTPAGTTVFVYDAMGRLGAEYGPSAGSSGTQYLATDGLGSTRLVTTGSGQVYRNYDYLPFGEELGAGMGGGARDATFSGAGPRQKFTGKERDQETGLDYFGFRHFSSRQGRWTSPDVPFVDQHVADPQSWNMYAFVRNNPVKNTDPNGKECNGIDGCSNYILGGLGAVANALSSNLINAPNRAMNLAISPFTNFRFPDLVPSAFTPSNENQRQGMEAANVMMIVAPVVSVVGNVGRISNAASELITVTHFTSDAGAADIIESGGVLRAGTYVTVPEEISTTASSGTVEQILEIRPGRGANSITFQTPSSNLAMPDNGSTTSGGALQFQLRNPTQVNPSKFKPTNPPPPVQQPRCVPGSNCSKLEE